VREKKTLRNYPLRVTCFFEDSRFSKRMPIVRMMALTGETNGRETHHLFFMDISQTKNEPTWQPGMSIMKWETHRWWIWSLRILPAWLWIHVKSSHPGHPTWLEKPRTSHGALVRENHRTSSSYFSWNQIKLDHNLKIRSWNQYSKQIISSASMVILCYGACHFGRAQAGSGVDVRGSSS